MRNHAVLCLLPVVAVGIPAQTVHLVGPGGLPEIASALAVAAPGDVVHVLPGTYAPFAVTIGCTIRGMGAGVLVRSTTGLAPVTITVPPGQGVHLVGLAFDFPQGDQLAIVGGRVTIDQCTVLGRGSFATPPLAITNADVHLQDSTVGCSNEFGFAPAVSADASRLTAVDSRFFGSPMVPSFFYVTSPALDARGTVVQAAGCTFAAGTFGTSRVPGLRATGGQVWLCDSTVIGYQECPIAATSVLADRCTLVPASANCAPPPTGGLLGVSRPQPLRTGATFALTYTTSPNGYAAVFASPALATLPLPGLHAQTQWLGNGVVNLGIVLADASGRATWRWNVPAAPWLVDQRVWFQGVTGFAFPLQLSPVAGGVIR